MNETKLRFPETLQEAIVFFADADRALEAMRALRWPDGVARCPHCASDNAGFLSTRRIWKCRDCRKQFSVKVGTIFEDSPLSLQKWMPAVWMIVNAKNGISSCELARALGVTQKTAWFMLQRIRLAMQSGSMMKLGGSGEHVEADETYIGGKARFMHKNRKEKKRKGPWKMTPVMGLLERTTAKRASRVILKVAESIRKPSIQSNLRQYVVKGSQVHTDELLSYEGIADEYTHNVINHAECYARGHVHTNGMENFWSLLKRAIKGTYVSVEPFHFFRYLDEQAFRFNERKHTDGDMGRFLLAMAGIVGKRLTYKGLIGKDEDGLPAVA